MRRLFKLKEWLTIDGASKYLSLVLDEEVSEADVLRLGLDGHLTLSVDFVNHARAKICHAIPAGDALVRIVNIDDLLVNPNGVNTLIRLSDFSKLPRKTRAMIDEGKLTTYLQGHRISEDEVLEHAEEIVKIDGVWDLPMLGGERLHVEHIFQRLTGGPAVTLECLDGTIVRANDGRFALLQDSFNFGEKGSSQNNYYPAQGLPDDSVIVVRTSSLTEFEASLLSESKAQPAPLKTTERHSLLILIAALCHHSNIDTRSRGIASAIVAITEKFGTTLSDDTVRRILKKLPEAIESRS